MKYFKRLLILFFVLLSGLSFVNATIEDNFERVDSSILGTATNGNTWLEQKNGVGDFKIFGNTLLYDLNIAPTSNNNNFATLDMSINNNTRVDYWNIKTVASLDTSNNKQQYFMIGSSTMDISNFATQSSIFMISEHSSVGGMAYFSGGIWNAVGYTLSNNEVINLSLRNINYITDTFDIYINDNLIKTSAGFRNNKDTSKIGIFYTEILGLNTGDFSVDCISGNQNTCLLLTPILNFTSVTLNNQTLTTTQTLTTNQTIFNISSIVNATDTNTNINQTYYLYFNQSLNDSQQYVTNNSNGTFLLNLSQEGIYNFSLFAINNETNTSTGNFTLIIDTTIPLINNSIPNEINSYNFLDSYFSCSDLNIQSCNISINNLNQNSTQNFTLLNNGNLSYIITAIDKANNSISENGTLFVNPFQTWQFNSSGTGLLVDSFTFGNYISNGTQVNIKTYDLGLTNSTLEFVKLGFQRENFTINLNTTSNLNVTLNVTPVTLTMKMFNSTNLSDQVFFDVTILNSSTSSVFLNQFNFSKEFNEIPTGDIEIIVTSSGFAQAKYFQTVTPFTSIVIVGLLIPNEIFSIITFKTLEFGSSNPISNMLIEARELINGTLTTVSQAKTDTTGQTFMNLDALKDYTFSFSKDGFVTSIINAIPGTLTYNIRLRFRIPIFDFIDGVSYSLLPNSNFLFIPDNFSFSAFTGGSSISLTTWSLTDQDGLLLYNISSINPTGSSFNFNLTLLNTTNITKITSTLSYIKNSLTTTKVKSYTVTSITNKSFTKSAIFFSQQKDEESNMLRWLIMIIAIASGILGGRVLQLNSTGSGLLIVPIVFLFSYWEWMPIEYAAVLSTAALFFFIGGKNLK